MAGCQSTDATSASLVKVSFARGSLSNARPLSPAYQSVTGNPGNAQSKRMARPAVFHFPHLLSKLIYWILSGSIIKKHFSLHQIVRQGFGNVLQSDGRTSTGDR
jgi:hypothetical protein